MISSATAADSVAEEVRKRIPTLEQFAAMSDQDGMGPDVTIPAIWMSLLLVHITGLKETIKLRDAEIRLKDLQASGCLPRQDRPMTPDSIGSYAGAIGDHAVRTFAGDRLEAASVVFQAGVAIAMTALPKKGVIAAIDNLVEFFGLHEILGMAKVLQ